MKGCVFFFNSYLRNWKSFLVFLSTGTLKIRRDMAIFLSFFLPTCSSYFGSVEKTRRKSFRIFRDFFPRSCMLCLKRISASAKKSMRYRKQQREQPSLSYDDGFLVAIFFFFFVPFMGRVEEGGGGRRRQRLLMTPEKQVRPFGKRRDRGGGL